MAGKHFFATKADIEPGLRAFEAKCKVKYVRMDPQHSPDLETYYSAFDIPNLGLSLVHRVVSNPGYLILPLEADVIVEHVLQYDGVDVYSAPWKQNSGILFRPGGWYENRVLMGGDMGNTSGLDHILAYYRPFARALTQGFTVIPDYMEYKWWVGPEALTLLDSGVRLVTRTLDAPGIDEDLKRL